MRKTFSALAALLFIFASCEKNALPQVQEPQNIKIDFSVSAPSADTRSVKKDWAAGDKINVWFDLTNTATPQLVLTYNGSTWTPSTLSATTVAALKTDGTGKIYYFYEGHNDLSRYNVTEHSSSVEFEFAKTTVNTKDCYDATIVLGPKIDVNYTFDGSALRANLNSWTYTNAMVEVFVQGISSPADFALKSNHLYVLNGFLLDATISSGISTFTISENRYARGQNSEAGGASFYFINVGITSSLNVTFELYNTFTMSARTYSVTGKELPYSSDKMRRIVLQATDFS